MDFLSQIAPWLSQGLGMTNPFNFDMQGKMPNMLTGFQSPPDQSGNFPPAASMPDLTQGPTAMGQGGGLGPGLLAKLFASYGVSPPEFLQRFGAGAPPTPSLGESLSNVQQGEGQIPPAAAPTGYNQQATLGQRLQDTLRGVKAPTPATPQMANHPALPNTGRGTIQPSHLLAYLQAMRGMQPGGINRPIPSLGQAIGYRGA